MAHFLHAADEMVVREIVPTFSPHISNDQELEKAVKKLAITLYMKYTMPRRHRNVLPLNNETFRVINKI